MDFDVLDSPLTTLGEGPFWDSQTARLGFVDIPAGCLHIVDERGEAVQRIDAGGELSAATPVEGNLGGWLVARGQQVGYLDGEGTVAPVASIAGEAHANVRFNDGKCDSRGRFWVGSMARDLLPQLGALYRIDVDGACTRMDTGLTLSNGLGWSPDDKMFYLIDTVPGVLYGWDFDADSGEIRGKRVLNASLGAGYADGMAVDHEGRLWVAFCGGGVVRCFAPDGRLIEEHPTPVTQPTCPAFGGHDGTTLYVTSATMTLSAEALAEEPAGRVLAATVAAGGPPAMHASASMLGHLDAP